MDYSVFTYEIGSIKYYYRQFEERNSVKKCRYRSICIVFYLKIQYTQTQNSFANEYMKLTKRFFICRRAF